MLPIAIALAGALVAAGVALAGNGGFAPATPHSPNASRISDAYYFILGFTGAIFVLVEAALVYFVVRYRGRGRPLSAEGPQIHGNTRLELAWTVGPVLILAAIAAFVFYKLPGIKDVPKASAARGDLTVRVDAHQFFWEFHYPNGAVAINRLRAPAGAVVRLEVTSPDVAHSWWIPQLGPKVDAIPGRTNHTWFQTREVGVYRGQCAELCGPFHADMLATVEVLPRDQFERWLRRAKPTGAGAKLALGRETFEHVCTTCHGVQGQGGYGPRIVGSPFLTNRTALEQIVRHGRGRMPSVGSGWPQEQVDALFAYVKKNLAAAGGGGAGGG